MITITHSPGCIKVSGHAGYAPPGQDIVCASVSALTQTFLAAVEELTEDNLICEIEPGNAVVQYGNIGEQAKLLRDSFLLGVKMIAESYPDHVRIESEV